MENVTIGCNDGKCTQQFIGFYVAKSYKNPFKTYYVIKKTYGCQLEVIFLGTNQNLYGYINVFTQIQEGKALENKLKVLYPIIIQIAAWYHFKVYKCLQDSTLAFAILKRLTVCLTVTHCSPCPCIKFSINQVESGKFFQSSKSKSKSKQGLW